MPSHKWAERSREIYAMLFEQDGRTREDFTRIWLQSGRYPAKALKEAYPSLILKNTEILRLGDYWGLPQPITQMAPQQKAVPKSIDYEALARNVVELVIFDEHLREGLETSLLPWLWREVDARVDARLEDFTCPQKQDGLQPKLGNT